MTGPQRRSKSAPERSGRGHAGTSHVARKRFGQHFLTDDAVLLAIVDEIDPRPGEAVVEIGPGLGALTDPLLARCQAMTVIELDRDLAARLRKRPELRVVESDVLAVDFGALSQELGRPLRVVGNLPYNISSPILFHLLTWAGQVQDQHFMLQKEVVDRMVAHPGTKDFGRLTVMLQWRYDMAKVVDVPPEAFDPPPKVDSAVVRMVPKAGAELADVPVALLSEMMAAAFSQRRKLLRHSLGKWLQGRAYEGSFDLQRRAEEVPVQDYLNLLRELSPQAKG